MGSFLPDLTIKKTNKMNKEELDKTLNYCLNDAFKVQKLRNHPNSNNIAEFVIEWLKGKELPIQNVLVSKINVLVKYEEWIDTGTVLGDYKQKNAKIFKVDKIEDINELGLTILDVKILN
mgnify:CR=1 FL=1